MKIFRSKDNGIEYIIRQAPAGNWCVDKTSYGEETGSYCWFNNENEAIDFVINEKEAEYYCDNDDEEFE